MQRPTLNPTIFDDPDRQPDLTDVKSIPSLGLVLKRSRQLFVSALDRVRRFALIPILTRRPISTETRSEGSVYLLTRMMIWLTGLGLAVLAGVGAQVYLLSHPWGTPMTGLPTVTGLHVSTVNMVTEDGRRMDGFLVPVFDEKRLIQNRQATLAARWPAVVLVSDPFGDVSGLDGLIPGLHDAGYVVMVGRLRDGQTPGTARTFGLHEQFDIAAAVNKLRELNYVDTSRISVIATGTAANAAMIARQTSTDIHRLVIYQPIESFDQVLERSDVPTGLRAACRWAFEVFYRVDVKDMEFSRLYSSSDPDVLVLDQHPTRPSWKQRVLSFLSRPASTDRSPGVHDGLRD